MSEARKVKGVPAEGEILEGGIAGYKLFEGMHGKKWIIALRWRSIQKKGRRAQQHEECLKSHKELYYYLFT